MGKHADAERWWAQSLADRETIDVLYKGERFYMVCFLSQQSAEKALKAFLYAQGLDPVFGHSVARYPNGLPDQVPAEFYDREDAKGAIEMVDRVLSAVRSCSWARRSKSST